MDKNTLLSEQILIFKSDPILKSYVLQMHKAVHVIVLRNLVVDKPIRQFLTKW